MLTILSLLTLHFFFQFHYYSIIFSTSFIFRMARAATCLTRYQNQSLGSPKQLPTHLVSSGQMPTMDKCRRKLSPSPTASPSSGGPWSSWGWPCWSACWWWWPSCWWTGAGAQREQNKANLFNFLTWKYYCSRNKCNKIVTSYWVLNLNCNDVFWAISLNTSFRMGIMR